MTRTLTLWPALGAGARLWIVHGMHESHQVLLKNNIFHDFWKIIHLASCCPACAVLSMMHNSLFCLLPAGTAASGLWDLRVTRACPGCAAEKPSDLRCHTAENKQQSQLFLLRVLLRHPIPNIHNILNASVVTQTLDLRSASNILYQNNIS